jgi:deoxycytidylate deaminase
MSIETQLISQDDDKVIMKALIMDGENIISTGYAEEVRGASNINKTSALENAETSAVGRALAFYGLGGTEIASADEVAAAISQQNTSAFKTKQAKTKSWKALRDAAAEDDSLKARETWDELDGDQQKEIWRELSSGQRSTLKKLLAETKELQIGPKWEPKEKQQDAPPPADDFDDSDLPF